MSGSSSVQEHHPYKDHTWEESGSCSEDPEGFGHTCSVGDPLCLRLEVRFGRNTLGSKRRGGWSPLEGSSFRGIWSRRCGSRAGSWDLCSC